MDIKKLSPRVIWGLLFLAAMPYFINLGASSIWDSNEAFYAEAPLEMMEAGDYLTPRFNYDLRLNKPILPYWTVIAFYRVFGPGELALRLPGALAAALTMVITFLIGRRLYGTAGGLASALALAASFKLFFIARRSIIDLLLLFFVSAAFLFYVLWRSTGKDRHLVLFYVALGLGTLTKGLPAVIVPTGTILLYILLEKRADLLGALKLPLGAGVFLGISAPWYLAMYLRHGATYLEQFFWREHFQRFIEGTGSSLRPIWYYLPVIAGGFLPWSLLLPAGLVLCWRTVKGRPAGDRERYLIPLLWFGFTLVFFSLSRGKQEEYVLQLYPAAALLVGCLFVEGYRTPVWRSWLFKVGAGALAFLFLAFSFISPFVLELLFPGENANGVMGAIFIAAAVAATWALLTRKEKVIYVAALAAMMLLFILTAAVYVPLVERYKPIKPMAERLVAEAAEEDLIGSFALSVPSLCFYTRRKIFEAVDPQQAAGIFTSGRRVFCVTDLSGFRQLQKLGLELHVLERRPKLVTTLRAFLSMRRSGPPEEYLLLSNRPEK